MKTREAQPLVEKTSKGSTRDLARRDRRTAIRHMLRAVQVLETRSIGTHA